MRFAVNVFTLCILLIYIIPLWLRDEFESATIYAQIDDPIIVTMTATSSPTVTPSPTNTATPTPRPTPTPTPTLLPIPPSNAGRVHFYGKDTDIDSESLSVGTILMAYDQDGVLCGRYIVDTRGTYGFLSCNIDDPDTSTDEGVNAGEVVTIRVNNTPVAYIDVPTDLRAGTRVEQPVSVPEPITVVLFGSGLAGLAAYVRKRRQGQSHE